MPADQDSGSRYDDGDIPVGPPIADLQRLLDDIRARSLMSLSVYTRSSDKVTSRLAKLVELSMRMVCRCLSHQQFNHHDFDGPADAHVLLSFASSRESLPSASATRLLPPNERAFGSAVLFPLAIT